MNRTCQIGHFGNRTCLNRLFGNQTLPNWILRILFCFDFYLAEFLSYCILSTFRCRRHFVFIWKLIGGLIYVIFPQNHILAFCSVPARPMWTKSSTIKRLDHTNKLVNVFLKFSKNGPLPVGVEGQILLEIWSKIRVLASNSKSVSRINTKSYMDMHCIHIMCLSHIKISL